jgi:hypothetical protein
LESGHRAYANDWLAELQENSNPYEYVGNNSISRTDPLGLWWGPIPTSGEDWGAVWDWFKTWGSHASDATDIANMGNDTLKCGLGMYGVAPGEINLRNNILTNQNDSDFNPPMHAGGDR